MADRSDGFYAGNGVFHRHKKAATMRNPNEGYATFRNSGAGGGGKTQEEMQWEKTYQDEKAHFRSLDEAGQSAFKEAQQKKRDAAQYKYNQVLKGGDVRDKNDFLTRDTSRDETEWRKNYFTTMGQEDKGQNINFGNVGAANEIRHEEAVRAANQGISMSSEDRRHGYGGQMAFHTGVKDNGATPGKNRTGGRAGRLLKEAEDKKQKEEEENARKEAKERSNQWRLERILKEQAKNNNSNQASSNTEQDKTKNMPQKYDVRSASARGDVKKWNVGNPPTTNI